MRKYSRLIFIASIIVTCCFSFKRLNNKATKVSMSTEQTKIIVKVTNEFLKSLSDSQRSKILFPFTYQKAAIAAKFAHLGGPGGRPPSDNKRPIESDSGLSLKNRNAGEIGVRRMPDFIGEQYGKAIWSNYPISDIPRTGLQLGSFNTAQREAVMHMLQELLSAKGFEKVMEIMGSDQALADGGTNFVSGSDSYTVGIFGTPNEITPWMVEFGGHHLGLNIIIAGSQGALTPTLTGAQPAIYQHNGNTVRVLAAENDKAFDLLNSFNEDQRKKVILSYEVGDLVLGPGHDGQVIVPEGLKGSDMTVKQKAMLVDLISQWAGIIHDAYLKSRMKEIEAGIDDTYFAWSGATTHQPDRNGSSYYRIQGPRVIIEFSPQGVGGDPTMHVHTIYRDPGNEYGNAFLR